MSSSSGSLADLRAGTAGTGLADVAGSATAGTVGVAGTAVVKTLLVIDLVDSTGLLRRLGDARAGEVFAAHDQLARSLLPAFEGQEIDKTDGFLLLFDRPIQAVRYALAYHRALVELGGERRIPLAARAGIHLGEVVLRENSPADVAHGAKPLEVDGLAKHTVARLAGLAGARQTLLTHTAFDLARRAVVGEADGEPPRWLAHGPYLFQGIEEPVDVFEVGLVGFAPLRVPADTGKARRAVPTGAELTLGWRPATGQEVPWRHHWNLERKLGDGGFGEVWLARHEKTGDHRVFKFCYDAERLRALRREVTLFRLLKDTLGERDDIARILDWNFKEPPFFLESQYTGQDLAGWVEAQGGAAAVPLAVRLDLVAQVAAALAAAHSVGVLHKDIKPSNILITVRADGPPRACLADFGIGLLTDAHRLSGESFTSTGFTELLGDPGNSPAAGTRLYLAPELLAGKAPSIQSDVYALGVLLFQMAVGDLSRSLAPGWEREVGDPLLAEDIAAFADGNPEKRPGSAGEVAERLRRLEERRQARADTLAAEREAEEMRLALATARRRRRLLLAFTALVTIFAAAMAFQMRRTAEEAARANREAEVARRVSAFLVEMFTVADPDAALGTTLTARDLLDQGASRIEAELSAQPEERATLMHTMGVAYLKLGLYEPATRLLRESLATRRQVYGAAHPAVAEAMQDLADSLVQQGDFATAESLLQQALSIHRHRLGPTDLRVAETLRHMAALKLVRGHYPEAERLYREALAIHDAHGAPLNTERAEIQNDLAVLLEWQHRPAPVVAAAFDEALTTWRHVGGPEHTAVAGVLGNKAGWLMSQGRLAEAQACLEEALAIKRKRLGDSHPSVAFTLYKLADLLDRERQYPRAEALAREAARILRQKLPPGHWRTALAEGLLGTALSGEGRYAEAEPLLLSSYPILSASLGAHADQTQEILASLVTLYEAWGKPREATRYRALQEPRQEAR